MRGFLTRALAIVAMLTAATTAPAQGAADTEYDRVFLEAVMQRQKGNADAAFDLLRRCIAINPDAPEAHYYIAQYYLAMRDKERGVAEFERASQLAPDNPTFLETLAQAYANSQRFDDAISALERLSTIDKGRDDVLEMLVQLYNQNGDNENTIRTLDRLELLQGKSERLTYAKSEIYTRMGNTQAAIDEVRSLAEQYPNDLNYKGLYADILMMNDRDDEAIGIFNEILSEQPDNAKALISMREYNLQQGDTATAQQLAMRIVLNRPTDDKARIYLFQQIIAETGRGGNDSTTVVALFDSLMTKPWVSANMTLFYAAYALEKKMGEERVTAILKRTLSIAPDTKEAWQQLLQFAWRRDDYQSMVALCNEAQQYLPDEMLFYYFEAIAHYQLDDNEHALEALRKGTEYLDDDDNPDIAADIYSTMGDILYHMGRPGEAYDAYDACLKWDADNYGCLNNYAYYLAIQGDSLDKAERMSHKTIMAEPTNATYLDTYAWVLFKLKRYAEAAIYIEQAIRNDSDTSAVMLEHAGDIYALSGDMDKAVELWQQASAKDPDNKLLERKIRRRKYIKE